MDTKVLNIGIVGLDSNQTKSYIMALNKYGYSVESLILILPPEVNTIKNRIKGAIKRLMLSIILLPYLKYFENISGFPLKYFGRFNYSSYVSKVIRISASSINSDEVFKAVCSRPTRQFIYAGGGIVNERYFVENTFIHAHPGYLPDVKGSHGTLWSLLVRGKFGCSCLVMDKGIDTGKILLAREFEPQIMKCLSLGEKSIERLLNFYLDPIMRALVMSETVVSRVRGHGLELTSGIENDSSVPAYYFMHRRHREYVVKKYLCN